MNKEILTKVLEIIDYIKETSEYKNYLKARELLSKDEKLMALINEIKKFQKEIVKSGKKELEESLAKFHATLIVEKIKQLDYSDNIKNKLLNLILADIKDKLE